MNETFARRAIELLRHNDRGSFTVPSARLYPHQWAWDSAFAAIGWSHIDPARGLREIQKLFEGQWDDGRIPHIHFSPGVTDYFPGPEIWSAATTSSITNPPVWTEALARLLAAGADRQAIAELLPAVDRSLAFFADHRDPLGIGCVAVAHPWESGQDNSPAWDAAMATIDPASAPPFRRVDVHKVADPGMRPSDDHYKRYIAIVRGIAEANFALGPFAVYDPFMTTMVMRAEDVLVELAEELGVKTDAAVRRRRLAAGLTQLWSEEYGRYGFLDARNQSRHHPDVLSSYFPIAVAGPDASQRATLLTGIESGFMRANWPLPSTSPRDDQFDPRLYWRGPTWVSCNWLLTSVPELSERLRAQTIEMVSRFGFWEYFHPDTGAGLGADQFTWTAALALDLVRRP